MDYLYGRLQVLESESAPMDPGQRLDALREPLLSWYRTNRRILPWREEPEGYRVWISEIMLQQTRVEAVKPYFARFLTELPDIPSLAAVEEERLLKLWEGLGYYNRARNLKKAAEQMVEKHGGQMPSSFEEIRALPGVGSYTAGAIASIAFGIPEPAVDGNVLRVMSRFLNREDDVSRASVRREYEALIREHMDRDCPGEYNQALIELGALVCIPVGKPLCGGCPAASLCLARRAGRQEELPVKAAKKPRRIEERTVFVIQWEDRAAVRQRPGRGLLAALYELPNREGYLQKEDIPAALGLDPAQIESTERLADAVHIFSHVEWHMRGYRIRLSRLPKEIPGAPGSRMERIEDIFAKYPLPGAFSVYTKALT